jgi:hypothetical protein
MKKLEQLTTKLTLIIIGLTAGSALLVPATYASFHPVTSGEIADNTIQSVDIGNGQVRTEDIGTGQVRTGDILDGQVYSVDIGDGQVTSADLASGAIQVTKVVNAVDISPGEFRAQTAECPSGKILVGGGVGGGSGAAGPSIHITDSWPQSATFWYVGGWNISDGPASLSAFALCV